MELRAIAFLGLSVLFLQVPAMARTAGNGDFTLEAPDLITSITGSFTNVQDLNTVSSDLGPTKNSQLGPGQFTLQMNTNVAFTGGCADKSCQSWQQFIYSTDEIGKSSIYMQYWMISKKTCPTGWGSAGSMGCWKNSAQISVPKIPITQLGQVKMSAVISKTPTPACPTGTDTLTLTNGSASWKVSDCDSILDISAGWKEAEFNIDGNGGGSKADFNAGTSMTVNIAAQYGSTSAPICLAHSGTTGETTNLILGTCSAEGGANPSVQFAETVK